MKDSRSKNSPSQPSLLPGGSDVADEFQKDDGALWDLLGVLEEETPSRVSTDFVSQTVERARAEQGNEFSDRAVEGSVPGRGRSWWWAVPAAAAAILVAISLNLNSSDDGDSDSGAPKAASPIAEEVLDELDQLDEAELLGVDVAMAEADDAAWFGN